jgi:hypothetical protein
MNGTDGASIQVMAPETATENSNPTESSENDIENKSLPG